MEGAKKRFIIPVYQRNYDCKTENCKQLYDDLIKVIRNSRNSHFFGSLVSVYQPSGRYIEFLVIDGQQRLTTISNYNYFYDRIQKKVYSNFKEYVEQSSLEVEDLLKELLAYARRYEILLGAPISGQSTGAGDSYSGKTCRVLDACIYRMNRLETTVTRPFFLEVLRLLDEGKMDIAQVTEIFLVTETYLFRRAICDLPANALNKIFLLLHREIVRYDGTEQDYVDKFKYALLSRKERARFPGDEEFSAMFTERPVFQMNSKNKIYILERLENFGTGEDKDLTGRLIARFSYKNMEQPVASWVEMFQKVLQILYAEDRSIITKPACSDGDNVAWHFSMDASAYIKGVEIGDGIYVLTNTSTQSKLSVLARVFRLYEAEPADLVFYLRDENEPAGDIKLPRQSSGTGSTQRYSTGITRSLPFSVTSLS